MTTKLFLALKKKHTAYFFMRLAGVVLMVFLLDMSIGKILRYFYFKQKSGLLYRTTYSLEKTNENILILGSSRANHHYQPEIFEKKLGKPCYNTGRDGQYIFYQYAVLKAVLKRYAPEIIILDFTEGELEKGQESYDGLSSLAPYYKGHPEIRSIVLLKGPFEKYKQYSSIYPFSSLMLTIAAGNSGGNQNMDNDKKGYVPLYNELYQPIAFSVGKPTTTLDSIKVEAFTSFIEDCIKANLKLYIAYSPTFKKSIHENLSVIKAKEIANKNNIAFFDYSKDTAFTNNSKLFSDIDHLNDAGARFFSEIFADSIQKPRQ